MMLSSSMAYGVNKLMHLQDCGALFREWTYMHNLCAPALRKGFKTHAGKR